MAWNIKFFQTKRGEHPVKKFIECQEDAVYAKILRSIELIETHGPYLKPPYSKKLQSNLYELCIQGKIAIRIFYTLIHQDYYLLHAFHKKSQKMPGKELKTALDRMKEII